MAATIDSRTPRDGSSWKRGVYDAVIGPSDPLPPRKVKEQSEERGRSSKSDRLEMEIRVG